MEYVTGTGQKLVNVHEPEDCEGWCVVHHPLPGPWSDWPTAWRGDQVIMGVAVDIWRGFERICPHGYGHPAPEGIIRGDYDGVHACDGCPCSFIHAYVEVTLAKSNRR